MSCPKGQIEREGYKRKAHSRKAHSRKSYKKTNGTKVASSHVRGSYVDTTEVSPTCVPDKGKSGKTPESEKVLPEPGKELSLSKYGYTTHASSAKRQHALMSASKNTDPLKVLRRLNLLRNYQADQNAKSKMSSDVEFMKDIYATYKIKQGRMNKGSKKGSRKGSRKMTGGKRRSSKGSKKGSRKGSRKMTGGKRRSSKGSKKGSRKH
jgi:hypothetical protein